MLRNNRRAGEVTDSCDTHTDGIHTTPPHGGGITILAISVRGGEDEGVRLRRHTHH